MARPLVVRVLLPLVAVAVVGCNSPDVGGRPDDTTRDDASSSDTTVSSGVTVPDGAEPVTVTRVADGDSLEVQREDGTEVRVRLLGVNAPELNGADGRPSCVGEAAREELARLLDRGPVSMRDAGTDRFDRVLGELYVDGRLANLELVEAGWAVALWSAEEEALVPAMVAAADAGLGWWGGAACGSPSGRWSIGDTQANPPGPDDEVLDQEWVEIVNNDSAEAPLDGYVLRDETTSNQFSLPAMDLDAGERLRVVTGTTRGGGDVPTVGLDERFPVWNNGGDTVLLLDLEGRIAAHAFIPPA